MKNKIIILATVVALFVSCGGEGKKKDKVAATADQTQYESPVNEVDTMILLRSNFNRQVVCNGKLKAIVKSDLQFKSGGIIASVEVRNGDVVNKGDLLGSLDKSEVKIAYAKAQKALEKARIDLFDKLIGQGYEPDTTGVPPAILKSVKITSGYDNAMDNLEDASRRLSETDLKAPFGGKIANLDAKVHQQTAEKFCTLIDDSYFDVEFSLLEAEMSQVKRGQRVKIEPFITPDSQFEGVVTEINPVVDDKGQVKVRAKVANKGGELIEGMNVKIVLENIVAGQYVVPKDAVVMRDNYNVIFRYVDGVAEWTYVEVVMSNIDSHVITGHQKKQTTLSDRDVVIISGNLNLSNGIAVTPKAEK